jgi:hypothetical protein
MTLLVLVEMKVELRYDFMKNNNQNYWEMEVKTEQAIMIYKAYI